jgi:hypothetical protein
MKHKCIHVFKSQQKKGPNLHINEYKRWTGWNMVGSCYNLQQFPASIFSTSWFLSLNMWLWILILCHSFSGIAYVPFCITCWRETSTKNSQDSRYQHIQQGHVLSCPKLAAQSHIQPVSTEACQDSWHAKGYDKRDALHIPDFNFVLHIFAFVCRQIVLCSWGFQCMKLIKTKKLAEFIHNTLNRLR